jgi:APA family basic amino acid/polyamine antiporter
MRREGSLGLWSGVGMNIGTMVGVGVFLSAGFMAVEMKPGTIVLAWLFGGVLAATGARAYAAAAEIVPRSGGEYRYLSDLVHPYLGYLAGWASFLAGFSAPIAANALAAGVFAQTLGLGVDQRLFAVVIILVFTILHAMQVSVSKWTQNALAIAKAVLLAGFVVAGLVYGSTSPPTWAPAHLGGTSAFMANLVFVMYAYSGWNTAIYAAEEFKNPKRDVPRAMVVGVAAVMLLYVAVNWVLVANLTPGMVGSFLDADRSKVTLGHMVAERLIGPDGAKVMSVLVILALVSAVSAMTMIGPRVYEAMARDGFLPRLFVGTTGRPPMASVFLQGAVAIGLVFTNKVEELITNIGVLLTLISALTVIALFRRPNEAGKLALACALVFFGLSAWMIVTAVTRSPSTLAWIGVVVGASVMGYLATPRKVAA